MRLSKLQRYILVLSLGSKIKKSRKGLEKFYQNQKEKPKNEDVQNIITKSLERLIDSELLIGYGRRTPHMWFIDEIKLTKKGRKQAKKFLGEQQVLPFRIKKGK